MDYGGAKNSDADGGCLNVTAIPRHPPYRCAVDTGGETATKITNMIRLSNGNETFLLDSVIEDERGPVHAKDCRGCGYTRCDIGCDHGTKQSFWHDDEHTETLWMVEL